MFISRRKREQAKEEAYRAEQEEMKAQQQEYSKSVEMPVAMPSPVKPTDTAVESRTEKAVTMTATASGRATGEGRLAAVPLPCTAPAHDVCHTVL